LHVEQTHIGSLYANHWACGLPGKWCHSFVYCSTGTHLSDCIARWSQCGLYTLLVHLIFWYFTCTQHLRWMVF
jgi:hypothetical protein